MNVFIANNVESVSVFEYVKQISNKYSGKKILITNSEKFKKDSAFSVIYKIYVFALFNIFKAKTIIIINSKIPYLLKIFLILLRKKVDVYEFDCNYVNDVLRSSVFHFFPKKIKDTSDIQKFNLLHSFFKTKFQLIKFDGKRLSFLCVGKFFKRINAKFSNANQDESNCFENRVEYEFFFKNIFDKNVMNKIEINQKEVQHLSSQQQEKIISENHLIVGLADFDLIQMSFQTGRPCLLFYENEIQKNNAYVCEKLSDSIFVFEKGKEKELIEFVEKLFDKKTFLKLSQEAALTFSIV